MLLKFATYFIFIQMFYPTLPPLSLLPFTQIVSTWYIANFAYLTYRFDLLLLLLSHFSRVRLCATLETAAHQAPPSLGFSRREHWSGLPFPSPMHESEKWKVKRKSLSCVWLLVTPWTAAYQTPLSMGFFQARVLEWGAIAFSGSFAKYAQIKQLCTDNILAN